MTFYEVRGYSRKTPIRSSSLYLVSKRHNPQKTFQALKRGYFTVKTLGTNMTSGD